MSDSNFKFPTQIKTGSQIRAAKRSGNVRGMTRAEACRAIAQTRDVDVLGTFAEHENKHVQRYAAHKVNLILNPPVEIPAEVPSVPDLAQYNTKAWNADQAAEVLAIMAEHSMTAEDAAQRIGCTTRRIKDWSKKLAKS